MRRLACALALWSTVSIAVAQSNEGGAVHFSDTMQGRLAWVVEDHMLPWTGAYNYLSSLKDRTALLTVADSSTGIPLGECSTNSFGDNWESFSWSLSSTDLLCTVSQTNSSRVRFVPSQSDAPRSFSVRIQASRGPRCMSSIVVEGRPAAGCPPVLSTHGFSQLSLQCGCPYSQEPASLPSNPHQAPPSPHHQQVPSILPFLPRSPFHSFPVSAPPSIPGAPVFPRVRLGAGTPTSGSTEIDTPTFVAGVSQPAAAATVHPCSTHVCSNGGRCTVNDGGYAECVCQDGFAGRHCENDVCAQVPCGNGGRCSAKGTIATCHCPRHTRGLLCEEVVCPTACSNGGSCMLNKEGDAVCDCPEGFTGPNCNVVDVCLGNAACSLYGPSAVCHIDEEATIAPRERLMRETPFECKCPLQGTIEWVDCISLHLTPSTSPSTLSTTTPLPLPSSSSSSISPPVVIPPLSPLTPHPQQGGSSTTTVNGGTGAGAGGFQPNPASFNARPNPPPPVQGVQTVAPQPTTTTTQAVPVVVPGVPIGQINPPPAHQFTFQTVIPPLGGGVQGSQGVQEAGAAAAAGASTTEQPAGAGQTAEMLPFAPPFFPAPKQENNNQQPATVTSGVQQPVQQVRITLPPPMRPVQVQGGSSAEERERQESWPESTTTTSVAAEGVAVPAASIPVFPLAPHNGGGLERQPEQMFPSTSSSSPPFMPLIPHFPIASTSSSSSTPSSSSSFPQEGAAIDAVEQTTSPSIEEEQETATEATPATMTTVPTIQPVQPAEERDPFESSAGSGFVASTMETTVDEWPTATVETTERSTVDETTMEMEEEPETTTLALVVPPLEEDQEETIPFTHPTTPSTTTSSTTTTTPSTTTSFSPPPPQTPSVFSRPRVPPTTNNNNNNMPQPGSPPVDPSLSSSTRGGGAGGESGATDRQAGGASSATASWIVAIVAIAVLGFLLLATALVVLRYVRQSRKLHGKYNPAREEHALSSAYAMPMATVTKEERLI